MNFDSGPFVSPLVPDLDLGKTADAWRRFVFHTLVPILVLSMDILPIFSVSSFLSSPPFFPFFHSKNNNCKNSFCWCRLYSFRDWWRASYHLIDHISFVGLLHSQREHRSSWPCVCMAGMADLCQEKILLDCQLSWVMATDQPKQVRSNAEKAVASTQERKVEAWWRPAAML